MGTNKEKEEIYYVAWDYDRYGVIARIGEDYIYEMKKKVEELEKIVKSTQGSTSERTLRTT